MRWHCSAWQVIRMCSHGTYTKMTSFFLKKKIGGHQSFLWGHWYPCFRLRVMSALGFNARVDLSLNFLTCMQWIPQINFCCDTCWPLDGLNCTWAFLPPAMKLLQGNVFTPFCHSFHRGRAWWGWHEWWSGAYVAKGGHVWQRGHAWQREVCVVRGACVAGEAQRAVRILLECILVDSCTCTPIYKHWWHQNQDRVSGTVCSLTIWAIPARLCDIAIKMWQVSFAVHNKQKQILQGKGHETHFQSKIVFIFEFAHSLSLGVNIAEYLETIKSGR